MDDFKGYFVGSHKTLGVNDFRERTGIVKIFLFGILLQDQSINSKAQSVAPTKIHFLNVTVGLNIPEVKTTNETKKPILLKSRTWVTVQTVGDSLGLILDGKPYFIHFEAHKEYYFVLQAGYSSRPVITEKSEREFILTANIDSAKGPEVYVLSNITN